MNTSTGPLPAARTSPAAASVQPGSRPVIPRCAPIADGHTEVVLLLPLVVPVTRTVLPVIGPRWMRVIVLPPSSDQAS